MSENMNGQPDEFAEILDRISDESAPILRAVTAYDRARQQTLDTFSQLVANVSQGETASDEPIDLTAETRAFSGVVQVVYAGEAGDMDTISQVFSLASRERVALFRQLVDCQEGCFLPLDPDDISELAADCLMREGSPADMAQPIERLYLGDLIHDVQNLNQHLTNSASRTQSSGGQAALTVKKSAAEHMGDVAKITAGVLAAMAIERFLRRSR